MSSCLVVGNNKTLYMSSDTAISSLDHNNTFKRVGETQDKIFQIGKNLIFCSGKESVVLKVLKFIRKYGADMREVSEYLKSFLKSDVKDEIFDIEILISRIDKNNKIRLFQISQYNQFIPKELPIPNEESTVIYSAGIKTKESLRLSEGFLLNNNSILDVFRKTYQMLECPVIGGYLDIWRITPVGIIKIERSKIISKERYLLVADTIVGRLLAGNTLTITNEGNNFVLDSTGATLTNAKFSIQTTNTRITIDPTATNSFVISKNEGGTFVPKFTVDNTGNVIFSGTLSGANGTFSGTITANIGNIGTLVIDSNGLKTSDGQNYLRGNGSFKWGGLSITSGGSATFTGAVHATTLTGSLDWSNLTNVPVNKLSYGGGNGTLNGSALYGGTPTFSSISSTSGSLVVNGSLLASGNLLGNLLTLASSANILGSINLSGGINVSGGSGMSYTAAVTTPFGTRYLGFSRGVFVSYSS